MQDLFELIHQEFQKVITESYLGLHPHEPVQYPYLTYTVDSYLPEEPEYNVEEFHINGDIFNDSGGYNAILEIEDRLRNHFNRNYIMTDALYLRFRFLGSGKAPNTEEVLERRTFQLHVKVDWRNK